MNTPVVSVLLAVHNGGPLLDEAIRSILAQTFTDFELLIIEDGSTDDSFERASAYRDPRVRVLRNEKNIGLTRSLNRGLTEARGEFIARQDADDLSAPHRFAAQVNFLRANPDVALVGSGSVRIDPSGRSIGTNDLPLTYDAIRWASLVDNPFLHTSVMFRRATAQACGGYDERFAVCQDYALWNRMAAQHRVANLPDRLVFMREHATSMTRSQTTRTDDECRTILIENLPSLFPGRAFSDSEIELLSLFRRRFDPAQLVPLETLLGTLRDEFQTRHPATRESKDFRETLCRQQLRLAFKFLNAPQIALPRVMRALGTDPGDALKQAMLVMARAPGVGRFVPIERL